MRPHRDALLHALTAPSCVLLEAAEDAARSLGASLWLVGGGVRDLAAGRPLHDLDLAFDADPTAFVDAVVARCPAAEVERTDRFGTATITVTVAPAGAEGPAPLGTARLDLARLRTESYVSPGALPEVRPARSIEADLARRDFSVNAVALWLVRDGEAIREEDGREGDGVVDPYDGLADLAARRLRVLHDRSFVDDATRLWRGARTAALFDLQPDEDTARLIAEGVRWLEEISGERLWAELAYTARRGRALGTMQRLDGWGVLRGIHPAFRLDEASARALRGRRAMPPERLAAVLLAPLEERRAILERFHAPGEARAVVEDTARFLAASGTDVDTLAPLEGARPEARTAARWLAPDRQPALQAALARWGRTRPALNAEALLREGVPRGPELGETLRRLRRARYLGTLRTPADARRHVRRVLAGDATWHETWHEMQHETRHETRPETPPETSPETSDDRG